MSKTGFAATLQWRCKPLHSFPACRRRRRTRLWFIQFAKAAFRFVSQNEPPQDIELCTKPIPGTLQEGGAPFQTTHWTVVLQAGKSGSQEDAPKALAVFCEAYWPPLYTFLRRRGYSPTDAQDIVQGFFEHLFQHNTLSRADQEKGRLRTFLLGSLQNFLLKQRERMRAIKRGGAQQFVPFDELLPQAEASMLATSHLSDVNSYDVAWASSVVTRAWKNVREPQEDIVVIYCRDEDFGLWILPGSGMGPLDETGKRHIREAITLGASGEKGIPYPSHFFGETQNPKSTKK